VTVPGRGYRLLPPQQLPAAAEPGLPVPDKPSIAVLAFANLSNDPDQEYFADGMVEEIITALSHFPRLFVIARNSSFTYKGRVVDIRQVGRELGVRYVLEGSVRKAAGLVRISGQLIDAASGAHLWADRFEGALSDIFALQDQVTASVVGAIALKLERAEIERARRKPTTSLDAYDYYLRGTAHAHEFTREASTEALRLFRRAIESDANFAAAYGRAVRCYAQRRANGWMTDPAAEIAEAARFARRAVELGKDDAEALALGALGLAVIGRALDEAVAFVDQALRLNPNLATAWHISGIVRVYSGEADAAIEHVARAMRLSPLDPLIGQMQSATAWAHFFAGRCDEAAAWAERAVLEMPGWLPARIVAAASNAMAGRPDAARIAAAVLQRNPGFRVSQISEWLPIRRDEDRRRLAEGLRRAGLPE
jgi:adenylate cyclase